MHQKYIETLHEILTEEGSAPTQNNCPPPLFLRSDSEFFDYRGLLTFILGILIGGIPAIFLLTRKDTPPPPASVNISDNVTEEMETMKHILSGLVATVKRLDAHSDEVRALSAPTRSPEVHQLRVSVERANLRSLPSRESQTLSVVAKDTFLLATKAEGGWFQVQAPSGAPAWISSEVVDIGAQG
jgi:hypothetical protein